MLSRACIWCPFYRAIAWLFDTLRSHPRVYSWLFLSPGRPCKPSALGGLLRGAILGESLRAAGLCPALGVRTRGAGGRVARGYSPTTRPSEGQGELMVTMLAIPETTGASHFTALSTRQQPKRVSGRR